MSRSEAERPRYPRTLGAHVGLRGLHRAGSAARQHHGGLSVKASPGRPLRPVDACVCMCVCGWVLMISNCRSRSRVVAALHRRSTCPPRPPAAPQPNATQTTHRHLGRVRLGLAGADGAVGGPGHGAAGQGTGGAHGLGARRGVRHGVGELDGHGARYHVLAGLVGERVRRPEALAGGRRLGRDEGVEGVSGSLIMVHVECSAHNSPRGRP